MSTHPPPEAERLCAQGEKGRGWIEDRKGAGRKKEKSALIKTGREKTIEKIGLESFRLLPCEVSLCAVPILLFLPSLHSVGQDKGEKRSVL